MTAIFLQVRLDSTRLPGKALLPLAGKPVIVHAMRALSRVAAEKRWILTTEDSADSLEPLARDEDWGIYIGPKDDVLARYAGAIEKSGADEVIRATGDNPLVSTELARRSLELLRHEEADYAGYQGMPIGSGVEAIRSFRLMEAHREAQNSYEREHVAPFLYHRPHRFRIALSPAPASWLLDHGRVTLDTEDDYAYLSSLFDELYHGDPLDLDQVVPWLKEHPREAASG